MTSEKPHTPLQADALQLQTPAPRSESVHVSANLVPEEALDIRPRNAAVKEPQLGLPLGILEILQTPQNVRQRIPVPKLPGQAVVLDVT